LIHEKLYQTKALSNIDLSVYITELVNNVIASYLKNKNDVKLKLDIEDIKVDIDSGINIGLMINELVSNSLKYAFPQSHNKEKKLSVSLNKNQQSGKTTLAVEDNGIGIPETFDIETSETLGLQLVQTLTLQLEGEIKFSNNNGTRIEIVF